MEQDTPARPGAIAQTVERRLEVDKLNDSKEPMAATRASRCAIRASRPPLDTTRPDRCGTLIDSTATAGDSTPWAP